MKAPSVALEGGRLTLHLVVEGELFPGSDGPRGKQSDSGEPLIDVIDEHIEDLQVRVTLRKQHKLFRIKCRARRTFSDAV